MSDILDDFKPDVLDALCHSCGEAVGLDEAFKENGHYFHPDCAEVHRCPECGEWVEKGEECRQCAKEKEVNMGTLLDVWPPAEETATFGPFSKEQMTENLAKVFSDWQGDKTEKLVLVAENGQMFEFTSGSKNDVGVTLPVIIRRLAKEGLSIWQVTDIFHNHNEKQHTFSPTDLALRDNLRKAGIKAKVHIFYPETRRINTLEEPPAEKGNNVKGGVL